jgi:hypothetical protein
MTIAMSLFLASARHVEAVSAVEEFHAARRARAVAVIVGCPQLFEPSKGGFRLLSKLLHAASMPFWSFLYSFIVTLLAFLVVWEFRRIRR